MSHAPKRIRLRDVAARAGVSVGSASQAFGRPELVSKDVRERVLAAAKELGYGGPDPAARRLRLGQAGALGLIVSERLRYQFADPASQLFLAGLAEGMEGSGLGLLLVPDSRFRDETAATVKTAAVDGFVIYSTVQNDPRVEAAIERRLPAVTVDQPRDLPTPVVGIDDRAAARSAAAYLRELGHTHVGVLSFITALDAEGRLGLPMSTERLAGYREGLAEAWDEDAVRVCRPNATRPARRATLELLRGTTPPTAILAMSDILALGALEAAAELGIGVPAQLSVIGFDDSPAARLATPALTTVRQPHEEKGRVAATWLVDAIEHEQPLPDDRLLILPTEVVVRDSSAPPA